MKRAGQHSPDPIQPYSLRDLPQAFASCFGGGIDWRPGMLIQYAAAGVLFALGAMAFETRIVHWTPDFLFALCWLVIVLSFGAILVLYFLIS
jgi:hypothetical protein